jgi:hypothetical protein
MRTTPVVPIGAPGWGYEDRTRIVLARARR